MSKMHVCMLYGARIHDFMWSSTCYIMLLIMHCMIGLWVKDERYDKTIGYV